MNTNRIRTPHAAPASLTHAAAFPRDGIGAVTIALAAAALMLLVTYVIQVNTLAAQTYRARDAQDRLAALRDERNALVAQQASLDDREVLTRLAQANGLVPAGAVVYLVQDNPVAAAR